jgi:hypothetical protein
MKIAPTQVTQASTTAVAGSSGDVSQSPTQSPVQSPSQVSPAQGSPEPAAEAFRVPKGQLERTRGNLPGGWFNDGGHNGFKPATITQVVDGYHLAAVKHSDIPRGRQ